MNLKENICLHMGHFEVDIVIKKVERDILAIGTPTTLLAYDVENNSDLFYKEVILILFLLLSDDDDG